MMKRLLTLFFREVLIKPTLQHRRNLVHSFVVNAVAVANRYAIVNVVVEHKAVAFVGKVPVNRVAEIFFGNELDAALFHQEVGDAVKFVHAAVVVNHGFDTATGRG